MHVHSWLRCLPLALFCTAFDASASDMIMKDLGQGVVLQADTGLRWTKADNGQDLNWDDATSYCAGLGDGWRLPAIDELRALYALADRAGESVACGNAMCKAPAQLQLSTAWHWSGTAVTEPEARDYDELAWGLTLVNGRRTMALNFSPYGARACACAAAEDGARPHPSRFLLTTGIFDELCVAHPAGLRQPACPRR